MAYVKAPSITIIIPTLNEEHFIEKTLTSLGEQTYPKALLEILVVDGGSTDRTCDILLDWKKRFNIKVLSNPKRISSSARNIGISAAKGEYILFIDAHVFIPSNRLVENMALSAQQMKAIVLGRAQPLTPPALSNFQTIVAGVRNSKFGHSTKSYIYADHEGWVSPVSIGVMYHRSVFQEVGLFDERFDAAEDVEFNYRLECLGYKAYISPDFKILYYPRNSFYGLAKQMFRYGVGRARFTAKNFRGFQIELFVPIIILISCIMVFSLAFSEETLPAFIYLAICGYILVFIAFFRKFPKLMQSLLAPIFLLVIHLGLAAGLLTGAIDALLKRRFHEKI